MSIGRAQAQLLRDGFLDNIGAAPPPGKLPIIEEILGMAGLEFIDAAAANLNASGSVSTGELITQLTVAVQTTGASAYVLNVGYPAGSRAAVYWDFNNKGVQGVNKPGNAPGSPYKFRYLGVSGRHALAIAKWLRQNGRTAVPTKQEHAISALETKRVTLRQTVKQTDSIKSLAYATAMAMKRDGLKPSGYFDKAVAEVWGAELLEALSVALGGEVILNIRKYGDNL